MIREGRDEDIEAAAALRLRAWPDGLTTAEGMRHFYEAVPPRAGLALIAYEADGELAGWASASRMWWEPGDAGALDVAVEPSREGEGIGSALVDASLAHLASLGVGTARGESLDSPAARAIARRRGFRERSVSTQSAIDPRTVEPRPVPPGVELVPLAALDDREGLYHLDIELSRDLPNETFDLPFDEWLASFWEDPLLDRDASLVAVVDGAPAGLTFLRHDRASGRAENSLCGVRRAYRRRGLATLLKSHSLRRASELGATTVVTGNDETNAPMLAVNTGLGYRPFTRRIEWEGLPG